MSSVIKKFLLTFRCHPFKKILLQRMPIPTIRVDKNRDIQEMEYFCVPTYSYLFDEYPHKNICNYYNS